MAEDRRPDEVARMWIGGVPVDIEVMKLRAGEIASEKFVDLSREESDEVGH